MEFKHIEKDVDHLELEKKLYLKWLDKDLFKARPEEKSDKFYIKNQLNQSLKSLVIKSIEDYKYYSLEHLLNNLLHPALVKLLIEVNDS